MILCINCSNKTKEKMDALLNRSNYRDYSELVTIAIDNLWVLSSEIEKKGAFVIDNQSTSLINTVTPSSIDINENRKSGKCKSEISKQNKAASSISKIEALIQPNIPDLFIAEGLDKLNSETIPLPPVKEISTNYTLDLWLFGQFNKLLPIKANCRALARLAIGRNDGIPLVFSSIQIAKAALLLGDFLADHDRRHQIGRDDVLATAFPRSGHNVEKSLSRYANQFVGYANTQNILTGLLSDYRLAGLVPGISPFILPTEKAYHFAQIPNPILDGFQTTPTEKFSLEEVKFLLEHIKTSVPVEAFAFQTLINAINEGADTPEKLDEALRTLVPIDSNRSLSSSFLTSQRSGALSRMADLGLIARVRNGVRVSYTVTEQGQRFNESK